LDLISGPSTAALSHIRRKIFVSGASPSTKAFHFCRGILPVKDKDSIKPGVVAGMLRVRQIYAFFSDDLFFRPSSG